MTDLLDITHYLLEEDSLRGIGMSEDPPEQVAKMRADLYRRLYKRPHGLEARYGDSEQDVDMPYDTAGGPGTRELKPYIPPTEITENEALPYGNVIGAPLGF